MPLPGQLNLNTIITCIGWCLWCSMNIGLKIRLTYFSNWHTYQNSCLYVEFAYFCWFQLFVLKVNSFLWPQIKRLGTYWFRMSVFVCLSVCQCPDFNCAQSFRFVQGTTITFAVHILWVKHFEMTLAQTILRHWPFDLFDLCCFLIKKNYMIFPQKLLRILIKTEISFHEKFHVLFIAQWKQFGMCSS